MRIATFNVQNLRLREDARGAHFDGARDEIMPLSKLSAEARALDAADRALTAQIIAYADADVLALQEVFDQRTLDAFHAAYLAPLGVAYPHRVCLPGNDGRRHVALLSRLPLADVQSHANCSYADFDLDAPEGGVDAAPVFRRDCLVASIGTITVLVVHFKAPSSSAMLAVTEAEALAVRKIIARRFTDPASGHWLVLGDVNVSDVASGDVLEVLTKDFSVDLGVGHPPSERWTYFNAKHGSYARPDRVLASPALAPICKALTVHRAGMSRAAADAGARLDGVGDVRPRASDHALLSVEVDV